MKKGLSLILTAVFLTAMLMVGGMSALGCWGSRSGGCQIGAGSLLPDKRPGPGRFRGAAVYQDQAFDNSKLKLSCVTVDGKDWLKYEYGAWFNGLLVDLNTAKGQDPAKGVTDWTGAHDGLVLCGCRKRGHTGPAAAGRQRRGHRVLLQQERGREILLSGPARQCPRDPGRRQQ